MPSISINPFFPPLKPKLSSNPKIKIPSEDPARNLSLLNKKLYKRKIKNVQSAVKFKK